MKKSITLFSALFLMLCASENSTAQINRTLDTKVADILAQLPAGNMGYSDKLMEEIIGLGEGGILKFTDMLVPLGTGDDTKARYAIQTVAVYSGAKQNGAENGVVEQALLKALGKATDPEVKTFLIHRLLFCGTNRSVAPLSGYLQDDKLYKPALAALTAIGTPEAAAAILNAAKSAEVMKQPEFIHDLGELHYEPAAGLVQQLASSNDIQVRQKALLAMADIASVNSMGALVSAAKTANYRLDDSKAIIALIQYGERLRDKGKTDLSAEVGELLMDHCTADDQLHFRSAGIHLLREIKGSAFTKTLLKEAKSKNKIYNGSVLDAASEGLTSAEVSQWAKAYKKYSNDTKQLIIGMLMKREEPVVFDKCILPAVKDTDEAVRIAGIKALAFQDKKQAMPVLFRSLQKATTDKEFKALEESLLKIVGSEDSPLLAAQLSEVNDKGKAVLVNVLAARRATSQFNTISGLLKNGNEDLRKTIYAALPAISSKDHLPDLLKLLSEVRGKDNVGNVQKGIMVAVNGSKEENEKAIYKAYQNAMDKSKLLPVLASLSSVKALELVSKELEQGNGSDKMIALDALDHWKTNAAIPLLFKSIKDQTNGDLKSKAFTLYLKKVNGSDFPADQKLLLIRKLTPYSSTLQEKKQVIVAASKVKTFLSLVFVSKFLDDTALEATASNAAIHLALPTPGKKDGLSGEVVRDIVSRSVDNLTGPDSQYIKIDVKEFLDKMPQEKGFVSIFNGKDLTGWEGLVKNPIARSKMSKKELAKAQAEADEQMRKDWFVKDGIIGFRGDGYDNICSIKDYADFEMLVDWKITNGGDSGIYLRGTPQVQIWDIARTDVGAQVGSGGLYNNQKHESKPLVVADNPIDEWNTFRIKMVGDRVTVHLNGVLVTDNVVLENYWDRKLPIFSKEAIELQAHGEDLGFRNVYVREIPSGDDLLSDEERKEGFKSLFNGKDLDHWVGNKTDYLVENNLLAVRPKEGGHGNLYTAGEYSDFIFRFEFKLTPGANNGLGIHAPLEGDAAYVGKELQILDNTAAIYAHLQPYQYHGSVYGIIPAKRGFLKPVGEWNSEEVIVKGDDIKITLNGTVIVDGNIKEATKNGTADHKDHPGLLRHKGHIGFLGHGSELDFRNIRVRDLSKN